MVQHMIIYALRFSSNHKFPSKTWYLDSGASNHMTNIVVPLSNVKNYDENLKINVVGDLSPSLTDVFMSPNLSTNLISIGQLVDNNCDVHFSQSSCVVQDQGSGKMIAKGSKVGQLFSLYVSPSSYIPSFPLLFFACNFIGSGNKRWHKCLGHPKSVVLCTLINSGLLGNKACSFLIFLLIVHHANLAKVKFYLSLTMHLMLPNVLILFIVMFGGLHLLFLILITNTLLLSLMTLVVLLGFTSSRLRLKVF